MTEQQIKDEVQMRLWSRGIMWPSGEATLIEAEIRAKYERVGEKTKTSSAKAEKEGK